MLMLYEAPFVQRRYTQLLDITVTLLQFISQKKPVYFKEEDKDDDAEYSNSIIMLKNDMKSIDEFAFFKEKIELLKNTNRDLLVASIGQFPETKRTFFNNILATQRVSNVPRVIRKIQR